MSAFGSKLRRLGDGIAFWCPGCVRGHVITVREDGVHAGGAWGFNRDGDRPTFAPSVLATGSQELTEEQRQSIMDGGRIETVRWRCHSFVTDGRIQFLSDCTHALAGQTVDLPDWPTDQAAAP